MITIICGTNRPNSHSKKLATTYAQLLDNKGVACRLCLLEDLPHDFAFNEMYGKRSESMMLLINKYIKAASKLVFIVPEYNGSMPGVLKTFLDAMDPKVFVGKKAALVGLSAGRAGNLRGLDDLTNVLHYLQVEVCHKKPKLSVFHEHIAEDGTLTNASYQTRLLEQIEYFLTF